MANITLVKMKTNDGVTADVHPLEVENYIAGGFERVDGKVEAIEESEETPGTFHAVEFTDEEIAALDDDSQVVVKKQCAFIKPDGEQCGNQTADNFCHIKPHK